MRTRPMQPVALTDQGELMVSETERERSVAAVYSTEVTATKWAVLIDLSDTVNWKHDQTGRIDLSGILAQVDRDGTALGAIDLGVVTRVSATNGDVAFFGGLSFNKTSDDHLRVTQHLSPSQMKLGVVNGALPCLATSNILLNSTAIQSDVALDSLRGAGTVFPAVGDIVARFTFSGSGSYLAGISLMYHAEA